MPRLVPLIRTRQGLFFLGPTHKKILFRLSLTAKRFPLGAAFGSLPYLASFEVPFLVSLLKNCYFTNYYI